MTPGEHPPRNKEPVWVETGKLGRPHGLKGEIYLRTIGDHTDVITHVTRVKLQTSKTEQELQIKAVRVTASGILLSLEGVTTRDAAARLTGALVMMDRTEFPDPGPDEFYYSDLEGAPVVDQQGRELGRVLHFEEYGTDVMFFEWTGHGVVAIPMVKAYVFEISTDPPRVVIDTANLNDLLQK